MSGSNDGYQEIDLDNLDKLPAASTANDIEIVDEAAPAIEEALAPAPAPAPASAPELEDDEAEAESPSGERKRSTRSQRLKHQRDEYARQLAAAQAELQTERDARQRYQNDANEGAAIGYDLLVSQLNSEMKALRSRFDQAFDSGDRQQIFDVQQEMASLAARKSQAERDRQSIPTKPVQQSGPVAQPQTQPTQPARPRREPSPAVKEWYSRNQEWFGKDPVMTAGADVIDKQMAADGYTGDDPDYFDELDKRLALAFPHKFGRQAAPAPKPPPSPTVQNRSTPGSTPGKIRVVITQEDRNIANQMNISVEEYARQKARHQAAQNTATQYTEIF